MIEEIFLQLRNALKDDALVYYGGPPHEASSSSDYPCCILNLESEDSTPNETLNTRVVQKSMFVFSVVTLVETRNIRQLEVIREKIRQALIGFQVADEYTRIEFETGGRVESTHSLIQWQDSFSLARGRQTVFMTRVN